MNHFITDFYEFLKPVMEKIYVGKPMEPEKLKLAITEGKELFKKMIETERSAETTIIAIIIRDLQDLELGHEWAKNYLIDDYRSLEEIIRGFGK